MPIRTPDKRRTVARQTRDGYGFLLTMERTYDVPIGASLDDVSLSVGNTLPEDATYTITDATLSVNRDGMGQIAVVTAVKHDTR